MTQDISVINAFSYGARGGNPAAVVRDGQKLDVAGRQALASSLGYSETAFVLPSEKADWRLEFYTPTRQIPHCGHATLAAFSLLAARGELQPGSASHESPDGIHQVRIAGNRIMMEQDEVMFEPFERSRAALRALGLGDQALHPTLSPMIGSTGNRFLLLPLANPSSLRQIRPNLPAIEALSERFGLIGFYPFALTKGPVAAAARMFAPAYGIAEEAATGMAAGPLGAYLRDYAGADAELLTIAQGAAMRPASPSRLLVDVSQPKIWVGGQARMSASMA